MAREIGAVALPAGVRGSQLYQNLVDATLRYLVEKVGGMEAAGAGADILFGGKIVNTYEGLVAREKPGITERTVRGRAGAGGAFFKFTVGNGTVNLKRSEVK